MQQDPKDRRNLFIVCLVLFFALIGLAAFRHFTSTSKKSANSAQAPVPAVVRTVQI